jgi:hypothetical protein
MPVSDSNLRALIRLIPVARGLKDEVDKATTLETYEDSGDLTVRSFRNLLSAVQRLMDDTFVASMGEGLEAAGNDKQKVLAVSLALSQLIPYLEGETGASGSVRGPSNITGRQYNIGQAYGLDQQQLLGAADKEKPE